MVLRAKEVSEQLALKQWSYLCSVVDEKYGKAEKFDVVSIKRETEKVYVVICVSGGVLHTVELAA